MSIASIACASFPPILCISLYSGIVCQLEYHIPQIYCADWSFLLTLANNLIADLLQLINVRWYFTNRLERKTFGYGAWMLPRHILCCELLQSWNFQTAITQSFLMSKFRKKSVDIENYFASSKLQKYFKKKFGKIFLKIFENRRFLIIE